jgi:anaerobic selenocysteine-containing dehydrogenase
MTKLTRRAFIKLAGASSAAAALYKLGLKRPRFALSDSSAPALPIVGRWTPTVCRICPAGCGIVARVIDGRVVKIEGNPLHPNNQGKLCPKGQAGLQVLYDPDRVKHPLRRVGERGSGQWQPIPWDDALAEVADRLAQLRDSGPEGLIFLHDGKRGPTTDLIARFCQAFGTPNEVRDSHHSADGPPLAHLLSQGWNEHAAYDWENTNYLLCFGGAFLEAWQPLVRQLRAYSRMRRGRPNVRAKIVQVESRASVTATKADEWIPIRPGTEGALALGIAHVVVRDELYDSDFVAEHTFGFEDWADESGQSHIGFRTLVLRDYAPERVAEITSVSRAIIERIAWEFAATRPAVAAGDVSGYGNSLFSQWAIHALNALVDSIDVPGGVLRQRQPPLAPWPAFDLDEVAATGLNQPRLDGASTAAFDLDEVAATGLNQPRLDGASTAAFPLAQDVSPVLAARILQGQPYPTEALFLYHANPLYRTPLTGAWAQALEHVPFIVSFSPYQDETCQYADLILPDSTFLEKWFYEVLEPSLGCPAVGLGQPVVEPLGDTRNVGDVLIALAQAVGGPLGAALPWEGFLAALQARLRGLFDSDQGLPLGAAEGFSGFWDGLRASGVWYTQPYQFEEWEEVLTTPSGRFEFYSQTLAAKLSADGDDEAFMPHYEPPRFAGQEEDYPLHLHLFKTATYGERWGGNMPWLQEIYGLHVREMWTSWVEINPETAHELGISDGDQVWVESPAGRIQAKARLYAGIRPEVVAMPLGQGHTALGRWAQGRGANPNELLAEEYDRLSGELATQATRVRVRRI